MQTKNRVCTVRITVCIRNEIRQKRKSVEQAMSRQRCAKKTRPDLLRCSLRTAHGPFTSPGLLHREGIRFVEDTNCPEHNVADNLQALRAEFVDGVLRRVPENIVVAIHEVDEID